MARLICWFLLWLCVHSEAAKVLFIPTNINSHSIFFGQLALAIAEEGDDATMLVASNSQVPTFLKNSSVNVEVFETTGQRSLVESDEFLDIILKGALSTSSFGILQAMTELTPLIAAQAHRDCVEKLKPEVVQRIDAAKYDFMVVDHADIACSTLIAYKLGVPYAIFGAPAALPYVFRAPTLPSFTPGFFASNFGGMTFAHRLSNLLLDFWVHRLYNTTTVYVEEYVAEKEALQPVELYSKASIFFSLTTLAFNHPNAANPNMISVGDVMGRPANPLPMEFQSFMDAATEGVLLVSQGSWIRKIPNSTLKKLCSAFEQIPLKVIWKADDIKDCNIDTHKVKIVKWMPQNDLLSHKNLRVFFTHAGLNSAIESIYHAKPMIAMPFSLDQPMNAAIIEERKFGLHLPLSTFTADDLVRSVNKLLDDKEIQESVEHASRVLHTMPESAGRRASYWINHVVQHGDSHLRTYAYDLNLFQFYMGDLFLFLFITTFLVLFIGYKCLKYALRKCCGGRKKEKLM